MIVFFRRYFFIPLSTLLIILMVQYLSQFPWYTPSLVITILPLTLGLFLGRWPGNLAAATIVTAYAYININFDLVRTIQIAFTVFIIAGGFTIARELVKLTLNGNRNRLRRLINELDEVIERSEIYSREDLLAWLGGDPREPDRGMRHHLAHILGQIEGWHQIYREEMEVRQRHQTLDAAFKRIPVQINYQWQQFLIYILNHTFD